MLGRHGLLDGLEDIGVALDEHGVPVLAGHLVVVLLDHIEQKLIQVERVILEEVAILLVLKLHLGLLKLQLMFYLEYFVLFFFLFFVLVACCTYRNDIIKKKG